VIFSSAGSSIVDSMISIFHFLLFFMMTPTKHDQTHVHDYLLNKNRRWMLQAGFFYHSHIFCTCIQSQTPSNILQRDGIVKPQY
jgi:hypothetical protein